MPGPGLVRPLRDVPHAAEQTPLPFPEVPAVPARHLAQHEQCSQAPRERNRRVRGGSLSRRLVLAGPVLDQGQCSQLEAITSQCAPEARSAREVAEHHDLGLQAAEARPADHLADVVDPSLVKRQGHLPRIGLASEAHRFYTLLPLAAFP